MAKTAAKTKSRTPRDTQTRISEPSAAPIVMSSGNNGAGATRCRNQRHSEPIPDWVTDTPDECVYDLAMFEGGGGSLQEISLSRDEFLALKMHLAAARGYTTGDPAERVAELVKKINEAKDQGVSDLPAPGDLQQLAAFLLTARELYRLCPEAVTCPDGEFSATLRRFQES